MVRRQGSLRTIALGLGVAAVTIAILTFYVWYQTESVKLGIDIGRSEDEIRALERAIETLELRKAELLAPGRVERIARDELGLVEPPDKDIIYGQGRRPARRPAP
ncbi:MAG: cell division protein FtsL [Candidatus Aminicenantes bacterium]|nr:cell division protein FtsL [Candidatus Aminicenantes bacterium]